jgi:methanogenic corrinoid protein MtbC1
VVATPKGQLHEIGAMLAAAAATTEGWHVTYLGPDLPAESIAAAAMAVGARAVALSIIYPLDEDGLPDELMSLRRALPKDLKILVGGQGASRYAEVLEGIGAVRPRSAAGLASALGLVVEGNGNGNGRSSS